MSVGYILRFRAQFEFVDYRLMLLLAQIPEEERGGAQQTAYRGYYRQRSEHGRADSRIVKHFVIAAYAYAEQLLNERYQKSRAHRNRLAYHAQVSGYALEPVARLILLVVERVRVHGGLGNYLHGYTHIHQITGYKQHGQIVGKNYQHYGRYCDHHV